MKRSLNELLGYSIETKDGIKGHVKDFLFDEGTWVIRYLEAAWGGFFSGRKVLVPKTFLKEPDWFKQFFPVDLTISEIEKCPSLVSNLPVSRKYEQELNKHYKIDNYWLQEVIPPVGAPGITYPPRPVNIPTKIINEKDLNTVLRSFNEVEGYYVQTLDGKLGHVDDVIVDDKDWQIVYVVVDTSNWLPWSKKVLIGVEWMDEISYVDKEIKINLTTESIKSAPEFDFSEPINEEYEKQLFDYYGRPVAHY